MINFEEIAQSLIAGKASKVKEFVQLAVDQGTSVQTILDKGLIHGMDIVGRKFKADEIYVPEVSSSRKGNACRDGYTKAIVC